MRTWLPWTLAALLAASGLIVILFSLYADRSRGRARCRRCAYRMEGAPTLTCPECGRAHRSAADLLRSRRHPRALARGALLLLLGLAIGFNHWVTHRPGDWWSLAPTSWILSHIEQHDTTDARIALWRRLNPDPRRTIADESALSADQWRRLAELCQNLILDPARSSPEKSWATVTLGCVIPDQGLVDPIIAALLRNPSCAVRKTTHGGLYPYYLFRGAFSEVWLPDLVAVACDTTCPTEAAGAAGTLARNRQPRIVDLRRIVATWQGHGGAGLIWSNLCDGLQWIKAGDHVESRIAFLQELAANPDPALSADAIAALKTLRAQVPLEGR